MSDDDTTVFHFLPGNTVGGISLQTLDISEMLNERGYENVVVTPDEPGSVQELAAEREVKTRKLPYNLPKHFEDFQSVGWNVSWTLRFLPSVAGIWRAFSRDPPDIVHLNGLLLLQPAVAAWLEGIDVVWYLVSDNIYPSWLVSAVVPLVNRIATEVVLISESNREFYRQQERDVSIIPGAIDTDGIDPDATDTDEVRRLADKYSIGPETTVVTTVGKTHPMKGQEYGIEALASLDGDITYLVVGPKRDTEYAETLEQLIADHGLDDDVHVTGFVDDKFAVLDLTDIFLLPSIGEGTPLSIMEAMAMGTPVVATDVGGVSELLDDGNAGQLVPPRSPRDIATAIDTYRDQPALAERHAAAAQTRVKSKYAISTVADQYDDVYRSVLNP